MQTPFLSVSVVLCTYNGAKFLREQLDTILAQDYPLLEVLVQDDGSTDDTASIVAAYAERF
ncbi:protein containing Glycosyl transferase, family 2 domain protein, partial [gut metagenome]